MTPSYLSRLLLLSSAAFFVVQMFLGALVAWSAPRAIRRAGAMRTRRAARWLLSLRLLPAAFSATLVALLCVPSYLQFEPHIPNEEAGFVCLAAAILGSCLCGIAIYRALSALIRSSLYLRRCVGQESRVEGESVWIVRDSAGLALAGILRPRLLLSERAVAALSSDELAVALRHEHAHRASRDNLKRLLILLSPAVFPGLRTLEQAWRKYAEWAADDWAADGNADRSAALAAALIRVARLQSGMAMPPLVTSLVEAGEDLSQRVNRLLQATPVREQTRRVETMAFVSTLLLMAVLAMNLRIVHRMLEYLLG